MFPATSSDRISWLAYINEPNRSRRKRTGAKAVEEVEAPDPKAKRKRAVPEKKKRLTAHPGPTFALAAVPIVARMIAAASTRARCRLSFPLPTSDTASSRRSR